MTSGIREEKMFSKKSIVSFRSSIGKIELELNYHGEILPLPIRSTWVTAPRFRSKPTDEIEPKCSTCIICLFGRGKRVNKIAREASWKRLFVLVWAKLGNQQSRSHIKTQIDHLVHGLACLLLVVFEWIQVGWLCLFVVWPYGHRDDPMSLKTQRVLVVMKFERWLWDCSLLEWSIDVEALSIWTRGHLVPLLQKN